MSEQHAKTWLGKLTKLNPNIAKAGSALRGKAPHKPLLLLCLLDMAEASDARSARADYIGSLGVHTQDRPTGFRDYGLVAEGWMMMNCLTR